MIEFNQINIRYLEKRHRIYQIRQNHAYVLLLLIRLLMKSNPNTITQIAPKSAQSVQLRFAIYTII